MAHPTLLKAQTLKSDATKTSRSLSDISKTTSIDSGITIKRDNATIDLTAVPRDAATDGTQCIPTGAEVCDGIDNDCNKVVDDGCGQTQTQPQCGNGVTETEEECDDGNTDPGDGCDANCKQEVCGNGTLDAGEACDDGNTASNDGCSGTCVVEVCGDGVKMLDVEECDDGNTSNEDYCLNNCQNNVCGDGYLFTGSEECDDGNQTDADGCNNDCAISCEEGAQRECDSTSGCPYGNSQYPGCNPENDNSGDPWTGGSQLCQNGRWGYCVKPTEPTQPACQPAPETCSDVGIDNDCDGNTEEADQETSTWYPDNDKDGHGDPTNPLQLCVAQENVVAIGDDCDDQDPARFPGNPEVCDGKDNDCNGQVDDGIDCNQTSTFTCPSGEFSQGIGCFATAEKNQVVCYNEKGEMVVQATGYANVAGVTADPSTGEALIWGHNQHLHFIMNEPVAEGSTTIKDYAVQTITMDNLTDGVKIADLTRGKDHVYVLDTEGKIYGYGETQQITETLDFGEPMKWITMTADGKLVGMTMNGILKSLATSEVTEVTQNQSGQIDAKSYLSQKGYFLESPDGVVYENMIIFTNSAANQIVAIDTSKFTSRTPDTATLDSATTFINIPFTPSALAMRTDVEALVVSGLNDGKTYFISNGENKYTSGQTYTLTTDDLQVIATPEAQGATSLDGWQGCEGTFDSGELTAEVCDGQDNDGDGVVDNGLNPETCCFEDTDCDDGDACTTDTCDLIVGTTASQCNHEPSNPDDGNACTTDSCDPTTGDPPINSPIDNCCMTNDDCADDGNACTTEECVPGQSSIAGVATGECSTLTVDPNDGDACTTDMCDPTTGSVSNPPIDTDDGDACTIDECNANTGDITHNPKETSDGNACTTDSCDPTTGNVSHVDVATDDNNACTQDVCNENTGEVTHVSKEIDDNDACTDDACNTTTGEVTHTPVSVDDGNACTTDLCNSNTGETNHLAVATDDGDSCTTDSCDPTTGNVSHVDVATDDNNACTQDVCNENTGEVTHVSKEIDDNDACTDDACNTTTGEVTHTPVSVDDGNACTTDSCNSNTGDVTHETIANCCQSDTDCDDGDACNGTETCIAAVAGSTCQDGTPLTCDDSNECTTDTCDASAGCQYAEAASAEGNACGSCGDGVVNSEEECDDGNTDDTDGCASDCKEVEEEEGYCGDGEVQSDLNEECDGSAPEGYECTFKCTLNEIEICDDGSTPTKVLCAASTTKKIECIDQVSAETGKQYEATNDPVRILADQNRLLYVHDSIGTVSQAKVTTADPLAREEALAQTKVIGFDQQAQAIVWDSASNQIALFKEGSLETLVPDVSMKAAVVGDRNEVWVLGNDLKINKYKAIDGVHTVDKQIDLSATLTDADEIKKLAFAKNQIFIATATRTYNVDTQTKEVTTLLTDADIAAMAVDARTKQIFVADSQGTIRTFDSNTTYSAIRPDEMTIVDRKDPVNDLAATDACPEPEDECTATDEVCDQADNDCDGEIDEGVTNACGTCGDLTETCDNGTDDDCDGTIDEDCTTDTTDTPDPGSTTGTVEEAGSAGEAVPDNPDEEEAVPACDILAATTDEVEQANDCEPTLEEVRDYELGKTETICGLIVTASESSGESTVVYFELADSTTCSKTLVPVEFGLRAEGGGGCSLQKKSINPTASAFLFFLLILSNLFLILPIKSKVR